jgi:hypothetical protein
MVSSVTGLLFQNFITTYVIRLIDWAAYQLSTSPSLAQHPRDGILSPTVTAGYPAYLPLTISIISTQP